MAEFCVEGCRLTGTGVAISGVRVATAKVTLLIAVPAIISSLQTKDGC